MRILISGKFYPDSFARCIATTAEMMGHTVRAYEDDRVHRHLNRAWTAFRTVVDRAFPEIEMRRQRGLCRAVRGFQPDLILFPNAGLAPNIIREIRRETDAKLAIWYPDHVTNLARQYVLAADYDAWFFKDPYAVKVFKAKLELNAHYLPEACQSRLQRPITLNAGDQKKYGCDLTTVSNMYYYRARMLESFKDYDLKIWGESYPRWLESPLRVRYPGVYVAELEKAKAFNAAKIVLNTMHYGEIEGVNCRLFEVAGCGAFQIADWKPALPDLFEPEYEIVTFHTLRELKEKVDYYLVHPEERQEIADRAYARAHREHTYEVRLEKMLQILGLAPQLAPEAAALQAN
jgi:spore maturation protein CgeB